MHPLLFSNNISTALSQWLESENIADPVVICDENTARFCFPLIGLPSHRLIVIPAGEPFKNLETLDFVLGKFLEFNLKRHDLIVNLGGGVVCDLGGFAASIYRRGIRFINMPTTLLAMADASIGGKTGIDYKNLKNYLGTFKYPEAVLLSTQFLDTLPKEHYTSAMSEIIKTAAVCDNELFQMVENGAPIDAIVMRCAQDKMSLVNKDFEDKGARQLLNFGHTIGHALESLMLEKGTPIMHGMAIASGMLAELEIAVSIGVINKSDKERIGQLITKLTGAQLPDKHSFGEFEKYLKGDKKNTSSKVVFSLPSSIGNGKYGLGLELSEIKL